MTSIEAATSNDKGIAMRGISLAIGCWAVAMCAQASGDLPPSATGRWPAVRSIALRSTDVERSTRFFTQGLGMIVRGRVERGALTEVMYAFEGKELETGVLVKQTKGKAASAPVDHGNAETTVIIGVPDASAVKMRLSDAGYSPSEMRELGPYRIFDVNDPDGHHFEIVQSP